MFVDASAIVAILTREPEADALADLVDTARAPITSPNALFEAVLGICRKRHASVYEAEEYVRNEERPGTRSRRRAEFALEIRSPQFDLGGGCILVFLQPDGCPCR